MSLLHLVEEMIGSFECIQVGELRFALFAAQFGHYFFLRVPHAEGFA